MNWKRKLVWLVVLAVPLLAAGCGGISGSHSVSPASFFLPGFGQTLPRPAVPDSPPAEQDSIQDPVAGVPGPLAQAR